MELIIKQIHSFLLKNRKTIAVAESCTGGLLSNSLTRMPGSSQCFLLGIVAYSNQAKEDVLRIPHSLIAKKGAVSKEVAQNMATQVRKIARSDFGIGITGIAGPGGGSKEKPVGTVFIALEEKNRKTCQKFLFRGNRSAIRKAAALKSLELLKGSALKIAKYDVRRTKYE